MSKQSVKRIAGKLFRVLIVLLGASMITFLLTANIGGNAAAEVIAHSGADLTMENLAQMEQKLGLNDPVILRYVRWLSAVLDGNFGNSYITEKSVLRELQLRLPATVELTFGSFFLTLLVSIPLGILSAVRNDRLDEQLGKAATFVIMGLPNFVLGLLLAYFVSVKWKWLPMVGFDTFRHKLLPTVTLALPMICRYIRLIKTNILEVMDREYIYLLRTRGMRERVILFGNALKNAFLPVITILGLGIGHTLGGAVIVENIFSVPGLGSFLTLSINRRDYPVIQAYILLMALIFTCINFLVDVISVWLDPRIRLQGGADR